MTYSMKAAQRGQNILNNSSLANRRADVHVNIQQNAMKMATVHHDIHQIDV